MQRPLGWSFVAAVLVALPQRGLSAAPPQTRDIEVEVDGQTVHAICTDGPRRAVLLHGETGSAESWRPVLTRLAGSVGACAYDRTRWMSDGTTESRGWFELLDELRRVHLALGLEPRYTLVGYSMGGMYARLYASDRPLDVGGLVLIEPTHEDMPRAVAHGIPRSAMASWLTRRQHPGWDGVREIELARHARTRRLPDIPVTVITAMDRDARAGWDTRYVREAARRVHASILRGVRQARHVPAQKTGHEVHLEAPDLVAAEITRMVRMTTRVER